MMITHKNQNVKTSIFRQNQYTISEYSGIRIATLTAFSLQPFYFGRGSSGHGMPFRSVVKAPGETPTSIISRKIWVAVNGANRVSWAWPTARLRAGFFVGSYWCPNN